MDPIAEPFPDVRSLLRKYQLSAKKSWSQNFLISERAYRAIVDATVRADDDWIVELGAGLGTLTMRLAQRVPEGKIIAVERDRDMARVLDGELGHLDNIDITEANALKYDLRMAAAWAGRPISVCGNLPYHIASQILIRIIEARDSISHAIVMVQKEMADRLVAPPGVKAYSSLGVILSTYADISTVVQVDRKSFTPAPRVDSTVIRLKLLGEGRSRVPIADHEHYSAVVHAAFSQRRKTLRNALRARYDLAAVDAALTATDIDGKRRGETLSVAEFARLAEALQA
jgi:16S rRNA (adenine1518-N6/adenine1519-N6)-dimethyltransferase